MVSLKLGFNLLLLLCYKSNNSKWFRLDFMKVALLPPPYKPPWSWSFEVVWILSALEAADSIVNE
jgi:hypothetical protein